MKYNGIRDNQLFDFREEQLKFCKSLWKSLRFNYGSKLASEIIREILVNNNYGVLDDYAINP